jgi:hypothetical protein
MRRDTPQSNPGPRQDDQWPISIREPVCYDLIPTVDARSHGARIVSCRPPPPDRDGDGDWGTTAAPWSVGGQT